MESAIRSTLCTLLAVVALLGTSVVQARAAGENSASTGKITATVILKVRDQAGLDRFLKSLYDPSSKSYRHFLTPTQFAHRFAPTVRARERLTASLAARGLQVGAVTRNGLGLTVSGASVNFPSALGASAPIILTPRISGLPTVAGVHVPAHPFWRTDGSLAKASTGYGPDAIARLYHLSSLFHQGIDGSGQTVAIIAFADYSESNLAVFDQRFALSNPVTRIAVPAGPDSAIPTGTANGQDEVEADIEAAEGAAPGSKLLVYEAPNSAAGGVALYNKVVSDDKAKIVSTSWGNVESAFSPADLQSINQALKEAAAQGQAFFAPSGDAGAYDGAVSGTRYLKKLAVDFPASDPWVTGVGGTTLLTKNSKYYRETVWSDASDPFTPAGSGGGLSSVFSRPAYQRGQGVKNRFSTGMRQVPDVSANADPATGYAAYVAGPRNTPGWAVMGGTSEAAPIWAGFDALLNQAAGHAIGFLNPTLYRLGRAARSLKHAPFHDVTKGHNLFYPATHGWDFASGWGSMDAAAFVKALAG